MLATDDSMYWSAKTTSMDVFDFQTILYCSVLLLRCLSLEETRSNQTIRSYPRLLQVSCANTEGCLLRCPRRYFVAKVTDWKGMAKKRINGDATVRIRKQKIKHGKQGKGNHKLHRYAGCVPPECHDLVFSKRVAIVGFPTTAVAAPKVTIASSL